MITSLRFKALVIYLLLLSCLAPLIAGPKSSLFYVKKASIRFRSEAALETITAESQNIQGIVNIDKRTFAFSVLNSSFTGFNSTLQREHFNENYLESDKYPVTLFKGKIIEDIDLKKPGTYEVRSKGTFILHGMSREKIIRSKIIVKDGWFEIESAFMVYLNEYNIKVPKVVHEKIAEAVLVELKIRLEPNDKP